MAQAAFTDFMEKGCLGAQSSKVAQAPSQRKETRWAGTKPDW